MNTSPTTRAALTKTESDRYRRLDGPESAVATMEKPGNLSEYPQIGEGIEKVREQQVGTMTLTGLREAFEGFDALAALSQKPRVETGT